MEPSTKVPEVAWFGLGPSLAKQSEAIGGSGQSLYLGLEYRTRVKVGESSNLESQQKRY